MVEGNVVDDVVVVWSVCKVDCTMCVLLLLVVIPCVSTHSSDVIVVIMT